MGNPPAQSKLSRKKTVAYAEAKGDKPKADTPADPPIIGAEENAAISDVIGNASIEPDPAKAAIEEAELEKQKQTEATPEPAEAPKAEAPKAEARPADAPKQAASVAGPAATDVDEPALMPVAKDVPTDGNPDDPAPAPGTVPPGDSRSFRRGSDFALIYRIGTFLISRTGVVGRRGAWRVVEYPTTSSASHGYAKESSRFVSEGFADYRG